MCHMGALTHLPLDLLLPLLQIPCLSNVVVGEQSFDMLYGVPCSSDAADLVSCPVGAAGITYAVPMIPVSVLR